MTTILEALLGALAYHFYLHDRLLFKVALGTILFIALLDWIGNLLVRSLALSMTKAVKIAGKLEEKK